MLPAATVRALTISLRFIALHFKASEKRRFKSRNGE